MDLFANLKRRLHVGGAVSSNDSPVAIYVNSMTRALMADDTEFDRITLRSSDASLPALTEEMRQCLARYPGEVNYRSVVSRLKALADLQPFLYETVKTGTMQTIVGARPHTFRVTLEPHEEGVTLECVL